MKISGGLTSKILVMALTLGLTIGLVLPAAIADAEETDPGADPVERVCLYIIPEFPENFKKEYVEGDALDLTGLRVMGYFSDDTREELFDYTVFPAHGAILGSGTLEIGVETILYQDGDNECRFSFDITIYPAIRATGVTPGNGQVSLDFPIASANGKGYVVYLATTSEPGSFAPYDRVNYNSKGVNIRGLANDTTYYAYIEYDDGAGKLARSGIVAFVPDK